MKKHIILFIAFALQTSFSTAQHKPAYQLYNHKGKKVSYNKMIAQLSSAHIVFFGELHNNPISHWLELEVTQSLAEKKPLVLGAEMIEADNQEALSKYLNHTIDQKGLDSLARLWKNHKTDYAPLVNFAKANKLPFVATNIPRHYANLVYKHDFAVLDTLSPKEKTWIAPLPIPFDPNLPTYQAILKMMGDHGSPKLVKAQAMKDATMAHFILKNYSKEQLFIHYNGAYHSDFHEGILWYIQQQRIDLALKTISTVSQKDIHKLEKEHLHKADFIICVDEDMTKTY